MKNFIFIKRGSIITEVLITMVIIVITMVSVIPMFYAGVKASKSSKAKSITTNIIQKEIEKLNQDNFDSISNKLKTLLGADFNNFIKPNGDPNKYTSYQTINKCLYVNKSTGDYENLFISYSYPYCDTSKETMLKKKNYSQYHITHTYSYFKGSTDTDDTINISVELKSAQAETKPVIMTVTKTRG